ncbi:FAD-binding protein [Paenibacillus sp. strain BS8-2]
MSGRKNWAGNFVYGAQECHLPENIEEVQALVASHARVKVIGSRHSFNSIADTDAVHLSLERLNRVLLLDKENMTVTVEGGIRYGELCCYLHEQGYALHNLASLPHITVAGACATATHGSGVRHGNLATAVCGMELVTGDGQLLQLSYGDSRLAGAAVGLGALGVVTKLTLKVVPAFEMMQHVFEDLPFNALETQFEEVVSSGYSVSLFTDWRDSSFNQVWVKQAVPAGDGLLSFDAKRYYGALGSTVKRHPVLGVSAENCSDQLGIEGPWHERLPHFRMVFTPSAGEELQSEYFVPRRYAYDMLTSLSGLSGLISPLLYISEMRTVKADDLWMSPCYGQDTVALHFTWKPDWAAVRALLPLIEEKLEPFGAIPHWGKLFTMEPSKVKASYAKLPAFRELVRDCDPNGKFRNSFLETYIY